MKGSKSNNGCLKGCPPPWPFSHSVFPMIWRIIVQNRERILGTPPLFQQETLRCLWKRPKNNTSALSFQSRWLYFHINLTSNGRLANRRRRRGHRKSREVIKYKINIKRQVLRVTAFDFQVSWQKILSLRVWILLLGCYSPGQRRRLPAFLPMWLSVLLTSW